MFVNASNIVTENAFAYQKEQHSSTTKFEAYKGTHANFSDSQYPCTAKNVFKFSKKNSLKHELRNISPVEKQSILIKEGKPIYFPQSQMNHIKIRSNFKIRYKPYSKNLHSTMEKEIKIPQKIIDGQIYCVFKEGKNRKFNIKNNTKYLFKEKSSHAKRVVNKHMVTHDSKMIGTFKTNLKCSQNVKNFNTMPYKQHSSRASNGSHEENRNLGSLVKDNCKTYSVKAESRSRSHELPQKRMISHHSDFASNCENYKFNANYLKTYHKTDKINRQNTFKTLDFARLNEVSNNFQYINGQEQINKLYPRSSMRIQNSENDGDNVVSKRTLDFIEDQNKIYKKLKLSTKQEMSVDCSSETIETEMQFNNKLRKIKNSDESIIKTLDNLISKFHKTDKIIEIPTSASHVYVINPNDSNSITDNSLEKYSRSSNSFIPKSPVLDDAADKTPNVVLCRIPVLEKFVAENVNTEKLNSSYHFPIDAKNISMQNEDFSIDDTNLGLFENNLELEANLCFQDESAMSIKMEPINFYNLNEKEEVDESAALRDSFDKVFVKKEAQEAVEMPEEVTASEKTTKSETISNRPSLAEDEESESLFEGFEGLENDSSKSKEMTQRCIVIKSLSGVLPLTLKKDDDSSATNKDRVKSSLMPQLRENEAVSMTNNNIPLLNMKLREHNKKCDLFKRFEEDLSRSTDFRVDRRQRQASLNSSEQTLNSASKISNDTKRTPSKSSQKAQGSRSSDMTQKWISSEIFENARGNPDERNFSKNDTNQMRIPIKSSKKVQDIPSTTNLSSNIITQKETPSKRSEKTYYSSNIISSPLTQKRKLSKNTENAKEMFNNSTSTRSIESEEYVKEKSKMKTTTGTEENKTKWEEPVSLTFKCEQCSYATNQKGSFLLHMKVHINLTTPIIFKETISKANRAISSVLPTQFKVYKNKRPYSFQCNLCGYRAATRGNLFRHVRQHKGAIAYQCMVCRMCFSGSESLKTHISENHSKQKHTNKFTCYTCFETFQYKASLVNHKRTHHVEEQIICPLCSLVCQDRVTLKYHLQTHGPETVKPLHACADCNFTTELRETLVSHSKIHLISDRKRKVDSTNKQELSKVCCSSNDSSLDKSDISNSHSNVKQNLSEDLEGRQDSPCLGASEARENNRILEKSLFACSECEFTAKSKKALNTHSKKHLRTSVDSPDAKSSKFNASADFQQLGENSQENDKSAKVLKPQKQKTLYACSDCDFTTKFVKALISHSRKHKIKNSVGSNLINSVKEHLANDNSVKESGISKSSTTLGQYLSKDVQGNKESLIQKKNAMTEENISIQPLKIEKPVELNTKEVENENASGKEDCNLNQKVLLLPSNIEDNRQHEPFNKTGRSESANLNSRVTRGISLKVPPSLNISKSVQTRRSKILQEMKDENRERDMQTNESLQKKATETKEITEPEVELEHSPKNTNPDFDSQPRKSLQSLQKKTTETKEIAEPNVELEYSPKNTNPDFDLQPRKSLRIHFRNSKMNAIQNHEENVDSLSLKKGKENDSKPQILENKNKSNSHNSSRVKKKSSALNSPGIKKNFNIQQLTSPKKKDTASQNLLEKKKTDYGLRRSAEVKKNNFGSPNLSLKTRESRPRRATPVKRDLNTQNSASSNVKIPPAQNLASSNVKSLPAQNLASSIVKCLPAQNLASSNVKSPPAQNLASSNVKNLPAQNLASSNVKSPAQNLESSNVKNLPAQNLAKKRKDSEAEILKQVVKKDSESQNLTGVTKKRKVEKILRNTEKTGQDGFVDSKDCRNSDKPCVTESNDNGSIVKESNSVRVVESCLGTESKFRTMDTLNKDILENDTEESQNLNEVDANTVSKIVAEKSDCKITTEKCKVDKAFETCEKILCASAKYSENIKEDKIGEPISKLIHKELNSDPSDKLPSNSNLALGISDKEFNDDPESKKLQSKANFVLESNTNELNGDTKSRKLPSEPKLALLSSDRESNDDPENESPSRLNITRGSEIPYSSASEKNSLILSDISDNVIKENANKTQIIQESEKSGNNFNEESAYEIPAEEEKTLGYNAVNNETQVIQKKGKEESDINNFNEESAYEIPAEEEKILDYNAVNNETQVIQKEGEEESDTNNLLETIQATQTVIEEQSLNPSDINTTVKSSNNGFKCNYCSFRADKLFKLNKHLENHSDMFPFECSFCPLTFANQDQLKVHIKEHDEDEDDD